MVYKYSFKDFDKNRMARVVGLNLNISTKQSIEICNFIRGKNIQKVKKVLNDVINGKQAIPYKRHKKKIPHRKGDWITSGRYPKKASKMILKLIESAEANAQQQGLNTSELTIRHIVANKAAKTRKYGRKIGTFTKSTHVEIIVEEVGGKKKEKREGKNKEEKKKEVEQEKSKKEIKQNKQKPKQETKKIKETKEVKKQVDNGIKK